MTYRPDIACYEAGDEPEKYRWVSDAFVEAFGFENVRVAIPIDFGRSRSIGAVEGENIWIMRLCWVDKSDPVYDDGGKTLYWKNVEAHDVNNRPRKEVLTEIAEEAARWAKED